MIIFSNPGLIDIDAALMMGVNAKASDTAIGYFGTGLKFAIATLLRNDCAVTIHRGAERFDFTTEPFETRGKAFDRVVMIRAPLHSANNYGFKSEPTKENLGFTTALGKNWEVWQAFRELYTNAIDEGGQISRDDSFPLENLIVAGEVTVIAVSGAAIEKAYAERSAFLLEGKPDIETETVDIFNRPSNGIFYRGLCIYRTEHPMKQTFNIKRYCTLSEDRMASHQFQLHEAIAKGMDELCAKEEHRDLTESILCAPKQSYERSINYNGIFDSDARSDAFIETVGRLVKTRENDLNDHAKKAYNRLAKEKVELAEAKISSLEALMLAKAMAFAEKLGFDLGQYPILIVKRIGTHVWGKAMNGKIYISAEAFGYGTKTVAGTLIEEYIHLSQNVFDETRAMQEFLINKIVSLGEEHVTKEPL